MKIETRYKVGDRVMVKADPILSTTCPFCNGQGKLDVMVRCCIVRIVMTAY